MTKITKYWRTKLKTIQKQVKTKNQKLQKKFFFCQTNWSKTKINMCWRTNIENSSITTQEKNKNCQKSNFCFCHTNLVDDQNYKMYRRTKHGKQSNSMYRTKKINITKKVIFVYFFGVFVFFGVLKFLRKKEFRWIIVPNFHHFQRAKILIQINDNGKHILHQHCQ